MQRECLLGRRVHISAFQQRPFDLRQSVEVVGAGGVPVAKCGRQILDGHSQGSKIDGAHRISHATDIDVEVEQPGFVIPLGRVQTPLKRGDVMTRLGDHLGRHSASRLGSGLLQPGQVVPAAVLLQALRLSRKIAGEPGPETGERVGAGREVEAVVAGLIVDLQKQVVAACLQGEHDVVLIRGDAARHVLRENFLAIEPDRDAVVAPQRDGQGSGLRGRDCAVEVGRAGAAGGELVYLPVGVVPLFPQGLALTVLGLEIHAPLGEQRLGEGPGEKALRAVPGPQLDVEDLGVLLESQAGGQQGRGPRVLLHVDLGGLNGNGCECQEAPEQDCACSHVQISASLNERFIVVVPIRPHDCSLSTRLRSRGSSVDRSICRLAAASGTPGRRPPKQHAPRFPFDKGRPTVHSNLALKNRRGGPVGLGCTTRR